MSKVCEGRWSSHAQHRLLRFMVEEMEKQVCHIPSLLGRRNQLSIWPTMPLWIAPAIRRIQSRQGIEGTETPLLQQFLHTGIQLRNGVRGGVGSHKELSVSQSCDLPSLQFWILTEGKDRDLDLYLTFPAGKALHRTP